LEVYGLLDRRMLKQGDLESWSSNDESFLVVQLANLEK
jgi:hypothetical protein